jgi:phosphoribosylformimino-5-aminoimidazole carboxamide ribotide isomerase
MSFDILPALDLHGGRVARMRRGDPATLRKDEGDPLEAAKRMIEAGARWLHVVDLDAAISGTAANLDLLERIATLPVRIQAGGGLDATAAAEALRRGAARAVLGAGALRAREDAERLFAAHPGRVAAGVDVRGDRLSPRGGAYPEEPLEPVLRWLAGLVTGPSLVVITDVERDGTLGGTDPERLLAFHEGLHIPILASGGVGSLDQIRALAAFAPRIAGVIVGRAFAEGAVSLADAIALDVG